MTDLETSPVTRRSNTKYKGRRVIVTLRSDDKISFRLERTSQEVLIDIFRTVQFAESMRLRDTLNGVKK